MFITTINLTFNHSTAFTASATRTGQKTYQGSGSRTNVRLVHLVLANDVIVRHRQIAELTNTLLQNELLISPQFNGSKVLLNLHKSEELISDRPQRQMY
ncbi:hypothetical protein DQQ10_06935 [Pseudochryseolinea flava]|uniref:Uncharacterized protein n=1 Tax=Pseudochryseolinea flava TaxID=2059302 RepID=A0A364Y794_9BACT|nr:hypothetical protein DQQ10_06935 [Pseudochryseolinea flava]